MDHRVHATALPRNAKGAAGREVLRVRVGSARPYLDGDTSRIFPLLGVTYIQAAYPSSAAADAVIARHLRAAQEEGMAAAGYFPFYGIRTHTETSASYSAASQQ